MITAILDAGTLKGKVRISTFQREIKVVITIPTNLFLFQETLTVDSSRGYKVMTFEYKRQLKKYTHLYTLKMIE